MMLYRFLFVCLFFIGDNAIAGIASSKISMSETTTVNTTTPTETAPGTVTTPTGTKPGPSDESNSVLTMEKLTIPEKPKVSLASLDLSSSKAADYIGEFESALRGEQRKMVSFRSGASRGEALRLTSDDMGKEFRVTLCARSGQEFGTVKFRVQDITYSNDGPSDKIVLLLNGQPLGFANTEDDYQMGDAWNIFKGTGTIGNIRTLRNGDHTLSIRVETDQWGVELDTLTIRVKGQAEGQRFLCKAVVV